MSAEQARLLQRAMAPCLKSAGFLKQGATWRRASPATIAMLNLQGSQWGPSFYVNLGVYLRELGDEQRPAERRCHVRLRAGQLMTDPRRFHELLDFEQSIAEGQRLAELAESVATRVVPWLLAMSEREAVAAWLRDGHGDACLVTPDALVLLLADPR